MMKLLAVTSVAFAVVSANSQYSELHPLAGSGLGGRTDECEGCDVTPKNPYDCPNPPCNKSVCGRMPIIPTQCDANECSVDCDLEHGYYPDKTNCQAFCFCSGTNNVDTGTGIRVPSKYAVCPEGTVYNPSCEQYHAILVNGLGWHGGCCTHPRNVMNFPNCPNGCRYLSQWHCRRSETCCWNKKCNCCLPCTTTTTQNTTISTTTTTTAAPGTTTPAAPITPYIGIAQYDVYPTNWQDGNILNNAQGHNYGLVFLSRNNKDARRFLYGYVDGEVDENTNKFKEGYTAYRCKIKNIGIRKGIDLRAVDKSRAIVNAVAINGCNGLTAFQDYKSATPVEILVVQ